MKNAMQKVLRATLALSVITWPCPGSEKIKIVPPCRRWGGATQQGFIWGGFTNPSPILF